MAASPTFSFSVQRTATLNFSELGLVLTNAFLILSMKEVPWALPEKGQVLWSSSCTYESILTSFLFRHVTSVLWQVVLESVRWALSCLPKLQGPISNTIKTSPSPG